MALSKPTNGSNADYAARIGLLFDAFNNGNYAFPATQVPSADANTLDDYEEGTWTMTIPFGGGTTGQTSSGNTGRYTKVGDRVLINGQNTLSAKGSSTGDATVGGLPFAVRNNSDALAALTVRVQVVTFADYPQLRTVIGTSTLALTEVTNAGNLSTLTAADFANTSTVCIGGPYSV